MLRPFHGHPPVPALGLLVAMSRVLSVLRKDVNKLSLGNCACQPAFSLWKCYLLPYGAISSHRQAHRLLQFVPGTMLLRNFAGRGCRTSIGQGSVFVP